MAPAFSLPFQLDLGLQALGKRDQIVANGARLGNRVLQRNAGDLRPAQHDQTTEVALVYQIDRSRAIPRCQHAVVRGGCAAALRVAQVDAAGLVAGLLLDQLRNRLPDAAQPLVPEGIQL